MFFDARALENPVSGPPTIGKPSVQDDLDMPAAANTAVSAICAVVHDMGSVAEGVHPSKNADSTAAPTGPKTCVMGRCGMALRHDPKV